MSDGANSINSCAPIPAKKSCFIIKFSVVNYKTKQNLKKILGVVAVIVAIGAVAFYASPQCKQWMQTQWYKIKGFFSKKSN